MNDEVLNEIKWELNFCKYFNYAHIAMSFFGFFGYMARKVLTFYSW